MDKDSNQEYTEKGRELRSSSDRSRSAILAGHDDTAARSMTSGKGSPYQQALNGMDTEGASNTNTITVDLSGESVPENVNPQVWALLLKINESVNASRSDYQNLNGRVTAIEEAHIDLEDSIDTLTKQNSDQNAQINFLFAKITHLEKRLNQQSLQNNDITIRSMSQNIVVTSKNGIPEDENEDCKTVIYDILAKDMNIRRDKIEVIRAHRLGQLSDDRCRPIVARLASKEQVIEVLKHGKNLKGTDYSVNQQLPPSVNERRKFCLDQAKSAFHNRGIKTKMSADKLFVNNELQRQFLPPSLPDSTPELHELPKMSSSLPKNTRSATLQAFTCDVTSFEDIRRGYDATLTSSVSPDVLIYAYRFDDNNSRSIKENYDSGGDAGSGLQLLRWMQKNGCINKLYVVAIRFKLKNTTHKGKGFFEELEKALEEILVPTGN